MWQQIDIENEQQWQEYRGTGIGASEAPTLLGYNEFQSRLELFHKKVGFKPNNFANIKMLYGHVAEELNNDLFRAYNGDDDALAQRVRDKKFIRDCYKLPKHSFIVNKDICPHLFVSPDRFFYDKEKGIEGCLEMKNTSSMYLNKYIDKTSPSHIIQLNTQMLTWEQKYGYLCYIIDSGSYREQLFEYNGNIFEDRFNGDVISSEAFIQMVNEFWESVITARDLTHKIKVAQLNFQLDKVEQYKAILSELEPEPDATLAYENYVKEEYLSLGKNLIEIQGNETHEKIAVDYLLAQEKFKEASQNFQLQKNKIYDACKEGQKIILGKTKFIEVKSTKAGTKINVKY